MDSMMKIGPSTDIYLYNIDMCELHGIFRGLQQARENILVDDFYINYPAQISVKRIYYGSPKIIKCISNWTIGPCSHDQYQYLHNLFSVSDNWECPLCTFVNNTPLCKMCDTPKI